MSIEIFFLVAFLMTFALSRAALLVMRNWDGGWLRLLAAHAVSLLLCWAWFAFGSSDGKTYLGGGVVYVLPQACWLLVDYLRGKSAREA